MTDADTSSPRSGVDGFRGFCQICGERGTFRRGDVRRVERAFPCEHCGRTVRFRDEAHVLVDEFGNGTQLDLSSLVRWKPFRQLRVYHVGSTGPIRRLLSKLPNYTESRFEPGEPLGEALEDGFRNEDLQRLTFADQSFDLVVSSHILEHVPDPWGAFTELRRVLRVGGRMIHGIPTHFPMPPESIVRASVVEGKVTHHAPPKYHASPEGRPALVFTNFGADLHTRVEALGLEVSIRRPHLPVVGARQNVVLVARRRS